MTFDRNVAVVGKRRLLSFFLYYTYYHFSFIFVVLTDQMYPGVQGLGGVGGGLQYCFSVSCKL